MDGDYAVLKARGRHMHRVKTELPFVTTTTDNTAAAIDAIVNGDYAVVKARGQPAHQFKTKLLFATTAADETVVSVDEIMDGNHADLKACSRCSVRRGSKYKNKGYKGTNRHKEF